MISITHSTCDVAIIGAGLAGLAATDLLKSQGYEVKVLEEENSVGGRLLSRFLPDNVHFEEGPFSFGNKEQPLWDYIHRFSLPIIAHTPMENTFWFKDLKGTLNEKGTFLKGEEREVPLYLLWNYFRNKLEKIPEDMPCKYALERIGASPQAIAWLQANTVAGLIGEGFQTISTKALLTFLQQYDGSTSFYAIQGGNNRLAQALAEKMKEQILLNHRLQKIEQSNEKCVLHGETFTIESRRVIFTIPLSEMKKIEIKPSLSIKKQEASTNTFYTTCARLSIVAPPAILGIPPRGGVFLFSDRLGWFRDQTAFQVNPYNKTVICVSIVGDQVRKLTETSINEWKQSINDALSELYPSWDPNKAEFYPSFWKEGYSYFAADMTEIQTSLREFEGRFHFAGEHTSKKFSSMNGAIESGIRAAKEILKLEN